MFHVIFWTVAAMLACIGFVQVATWILVRAGWKGNHVYRVFPIGGEGKKAGDQMALFYACLQWEANPSRQTYLLYDAGLDAQASKDCAELAKGVGVRLVHSAEELAELMKP